MREIIPQFFTSLSVISAILVVSQLVRLSEVLVAFGITIENILLPFLFIILPFLSLTIPMALLFSVVLAFSRLSSDGEFTALLASGYSLSRAAVPVVVLSLGLYLAGAVCGLYFEPWGRREFVNFYKRKAQTELDNVIKYQLQPGVFMRNFLGYVFYAEKISPDRTRFDNVLLAPGDSYRGRQSFAMLAPSGGISGSVDDQDLKMSFDYGMIYAADALSTKSTVVKFKRAELDILRIFQEQMFGSSDERDDYRAYPPGRLWRHIDTLEEKTKTGAEPKDAYWKARFLFHQRAGMPFVTVAFALIAMVIGIQDPRRGKSMAWIGAILAIICSYILLMTFKWLAEHGHINAPLAAWIPNIALAGFGFFMVYQRNRLPLSEGTLSPRNIPALSWLFRIS